MEIFQKEALDIKNYLERNGYIAKQMSDHIIVLDPIRSSTNGIVYDEVEVWGWVDATNFVDERA